MAAKQIAIGPEFFAKAKNDYEDFHWAIVREFLQNSIDCGSSRIVVSIRPDGGDTLLTVANDGDPMDLDILEGKLLCLGGSGKNFGGTVGGFGKAKEILYFCHKEYTIHSGWLKVIGSGAGYEINDGEQSGTISHIGGTHSTIRMENNHCDELYRALRKFAKYAQWSGDLVINRDGEEERLSCDQSKGARRRDLGFGVVFTNKSDSHRCVVRIGGIPMFVQYCGHGRLVIVELSGKSDEILTSNRDGLVSPFRGELSSFITELSVDKKSALRPSVPKYERFEGQKIAHRHKRETMDVRALVEIPEDVAPESDRPEVTETMADGTPVEGVNLGDSPNPVGSVSLGSRDSGGHVRSAAYTTSSEIRRVVTLGSEFVIKNETDLIVPNYYRPDSSEFSTYSRKLIKIWGRLMLELHRLFDHEAEFGVGFIFEEGETGAEHENGPYGRVYYISPAKVVEQSSTYSKSFKKRWSFDNAGKKMLLSVATHEFVHGLGYNWHDETFAQKYTVVVGELLRDQKRFGWCFR